MEVREDAKDGREKQTFLINKKRKWEFAGTNRGKTKHWVFSCLSLEDKTNINA